MTNEDLQIKRQELCGEFWVDLRDALEQIGGDSAIVDMYMDAPLSDFVDLVAPNGIRPVFKKTGHIHYKQLPPKKE
jgi:hypothetical protein